MFLNIFSSIFASGASWVSDNPVVALAFKHIEEVVLECDTQKEYRCLYNYL